MSGSQMLVAILPCNDLDASEAFYTRFGFTRRSGPDDYRMLANNAGAELHLTSAVEGWLVPGRNPFGLYLYSEDVEMFAERFGKRAEHMPWAMYEFAVSDPDETLVRVGWPMRLRATS